MALWNTHGPNKHLYAAQRRLALPQTHVDRCAKDNSIHRINTAVCSLCHRYHAQLQAHGSYGFFPGERQDAAGALTEAEKTVEQLAIMLIAAMEMVDEGWQAYSLPPPLRAFTLVVHSECPVPVEPIVAAPPTEPVAVELAAPPLLDHPNGDGQSDPLGEPDGLDIAPSIPLPHPRPARPAKVRT